MATSSQATPWPEFPSTPRLAGQNSTGWPIGTDNLAEGNYIGTNLTGTLAIGNAGPGVQFIAGATNNTLGGTAIGAGNVIAFNTGDGVLVGQTPTDASTGNAILSNSIYGNAGIGIDLGGNGVLPDHSSPTTGLVAGTPNGDRTSPVLTSATFVPDTEDSSGTLTVSGSLEADPNTTYFIQLFANSTSDPSGYGQGQTLIASFPVTTDASGTFTGTGTFTTPNLTGEFILATATDPDGNTSEFSEDLSVVSTSASSLVVPIVTNPATEQSLLQSVISEVQGLPTGTAVPTVVLEPTSVSQLNEIVAAINALSSQPAPIVIVEIDLGGQSLLANSALFPPAGVQVEIQNGTLASTWYVDSSNTSASPVGSQSNPFAAIHAAFGAAGPGDLIVVEPGNGYNESDTVNVPNLTIDGVGTVLDGQVGPQQSPGFTVDSGGVTISGFTIEHFDDSPAVVVAGGSLTLADDTIAHNSSDGSGGGILNEGASRSRTARLPGIRRPRAVGSATRTRWSPST